MAALEFLIPAFGIQALKVREYRRNQGEGLTVGSGGNYPVAEGSESVNIAGLPADKFNLFGLPVFAPLSLKLGDVVIDLDTSIMTVLQSNHIIRTKVEGRDGTVKEHYSADDYEINIKAAIVGVDSEAFPYDEVGTLRELLSSRREIEVISDYLLLFDVFSIAIDNVRHIQTPGTINTHAFEITAYSDSPEELLEYVGDE